LIVIGFYIFKHIVKTGSSGMVIVPILVYHSLLNFSKNILAFRVYLEHTNSTTNNEVIIPD